MRRFGVTLAIVAGLGGQPALADIEADLATIADAFVTEEIMDSVLSSAMPGMEAMFRAPIATPNGEIQFSRRAQDVIIPRFRAAMTEIIHAEMRGMFITSHEAELSPEAIGAFADFLRSEEGQEFARAQPRIMQRSHELGAQIGVRLALDLMPKVLADLVKSGTPVFDPETETKLRLWLRERGHEDL
ncbi:MAG: DUF2059 domain-containing protein [Pseudomonadota bacterium]